ncbi:MAG TPA: hypothetical protein VIH49_04410 [Solirubrobacteraceae bacterium]|jgi:hypothetical protein
MASSGKKKTTMAKLMRESKLREKRLDKQARKDARKLAGTNGSDWLADGPNPMGAESPEPDAAQSDDHEPLTQVTADA